MHVRRRAIAAVALAATLAVGAGACGGSSGSSGQAPGPPAAEVSPSGDIPDTQAFVPFTPASGGYTIQVPEGWARTDLPNGVVFTDKLNSIRVESSSVATAPSATSAQANDVPTLAASVAGFSLGRISTVRRTAGDAVLVTYRAKGSADPVTGKSVTQDVERYEFWKDGTLVVITLTSPKGADNVDPWKTVTNAFGWQ